MSGTVATGLLTADFNCSKIKQRLPIQEERLQGVNQRCLQLNGTWKDPDWEGFFFIRQKRFAMCFVGKAGSISWERIMLQLTGNKETARGANTLPRKEVHRKIGLQVGSATHIDSSKRLAYLLDSHKTMIVRDPLTRLISAYRNIVLFLKQEAHRIKRICRPKVSHSSQKFKKEVTFAQFVCYVLRAKKYKIATNFHWKPQHENCRPCSIKYDSISYYETLRDDSEYILLRIAAGPNITLVPRSIDTPYASSGGYLQLYDTVPANDIRGLLDFYKDDYNIFGYQIPERIRSRLHKAQGD